MCDHNECVFKINCMGYMLIVGVVYRPRNTLDFIDSVHDIFEKISHYPCYIMGDFNLDLLKHELHRPTEKFLDIMYANSYIPMINRTTKVTRDTCTLIDNIFTNNYSISSNVFSGILKSDITDHYILFHIIKTKDDKKLYWIQNCWNCQWISNQPIHRKDTKCYLVFIKFMQRLSNIFLKILRIVQNYLWWIIFHSLELKCDTEIAFPGSQIDWKKSIKYINQLYRISVKHPTSHNISKYKNYKNKLYSISRKEEKCIIKQKLSLTKIILEKCGPSLNQSLRKRKVRRHMINLCTIIGILLIPRSSQTVLTIIL